MGEEKSRGTNNNQIWSQEKLESAEGKGTVAVKEEKKKYKNVIPNKQFSWNVRRKGGGGESRQNVVVVFKINSKYQILWRQRDILGSQNISHHYFKSY